MKMLPPVVPANMAGEGAPAAEVYYPAMTVTDSGLNDYPVLVWRQPWLSPDSILYWPPLIDIDRTPFVAWDKRIGQ